MARGEFNLKPDWTLIDSKMAGSLVGMSFFGIIVGFSNIMVLNIDSIIVSRMIGIEATGIYAITFFFSTLIIIPSRSLRKISGTILADAWKNNEMNTIAQIYRKSSINQLIFGALIFIGLWANIHNVFKILPPEYEAGKYVIFFLGITNLIEMTSGVSNSMLATSKYYKVTAFLSLLLVILIVGFNIIFIRQLGLVGAAIASTAAYFIYNVLRYIIIYRLFGMLPFTQQHFYTLIMALATYGISLLIPVIGNFVVDIAIRSFTIAVVYGAGAYFLKLSEDINGTVDSIINKFFR
jgi:O-antigen/teichoic acid export membrane protein